MSLRFFIHMASSGRAWRGTVAGEVLLDDAEQRADKMIDRFDLNADWLWDWERDYHSIEAPDQLAMQAPYHVR